MAVAKKEKVYLKDTDIWDSIDHSASAEQFPETYARLDSLTHGSGKKLVWKCHDDHSWPAVVKTRINGHGCPYCSGRMATDSNRLSICSPGVSSEWDYGKNVDRSPEDVTVGSERKFWWVCYEGHSWQASVYSRTNGSGCPYCSGLLVTDSNRLSVCYPSIALEWDYGKNGTTHPKDISASTHRRFWWICADGHSWQAAVYNRTNGKGCPYCSGRLATDNNRLSVRYPSVALEWDYEKNGHTSPEDITVSSKHKFWWVCSEGHSWESAVGNRTSGQGCPFCSGRRLTDSNQLFARYPRISAEWDYGKNKGITPKDVSYGSNRRFWWVCFEGHSWETKVNHRTALGSGCPKCAKRTSKIERRFIETFAEYTDFTLTAHGMRLGQLYYASGRSGVEVDIILYRNNHYLLVEYDGSYWHREKTDMDTDKSRALLSLGDNILHARIRENDLPNLDLAHDRFAQFRHDYHATEGDSIERTVKNIKQWFLEKIGV